LERTETTIFPSSTTPGVFARFLSLEAVLTEIGKTVQSDSYFEYLSTKVTFPLTPSAAQGFVGIVLKGAARNRFST
jgi:hypothetical protein